MLFVCSVPRRQLFLGPSRGHSQGRCLLFSVVRILVAELHSAFLDRLCNMQRTLCPFLWGLRAAVRAEDVAVAVVKVSCSRSITSDIFRSFLGFRASKLKTETLGPLVCMSQSNLVIFCFT